VLESSLMSHTCPDCGASVEYARRNATVLSGACGACGLTLTVLADGAGEVEPGTETAAPAGPPCSNCGAPVRVQAPGPGRLETVCSSCDTRTVYTSAAAGEVEARPFRGRPRREDRSGNVPIGRARPCRECGGALRFTPNPDGTIAAECDSCGNRFVLPPRREGGYGAPRGGPRYDRPPNRGYGGDRDRRGFGRPPNRREGYRPRPRRDEDEDEDRPRPRRRRE
jgi:hypothetical protein